MKSWRSTRVVLTFKSSNQSFGPVPTLDGIIPFHILDPQDMAFSALGCVAAGSLRSGVFYCFSRVKRHTRALVGSNYAAD
jgi:hypothetical protein